MSGGSSRFAAGCWLVVLAALGGCGAEGAGTTTSSQRPGTTAGAPGTSPTAATQPGPAVSRPGPPAAGTCSVSVDDPRPNVGAVVTATVVSAMANTTFLARTSDGSDGGSGTTDAAGSGTVRLRVPADPGGTGVQVEISLAGGTETCSVGLNPR